MRFILAAAPAETQAAAHHCRTLAHVAYRIGPDSTLLRQNTLRAKGGILCVSDREAPPINAPETFCAAVIRECGRQNFSGVLLDFEEAPRQDRLVLARSLAQILSENKKVLYLPEKYTQTGPNAVILVCTALSGGNFNQRLQEAKAAGCQGLDVQRLRMDFTLPAPSGEGTPLSGEELHQLMEREQPTVFFSRDLCTRYFTYARDGRVHFVLFDDAETLNRKVQIGTSLGFSTAFFMWPEIKDIAGKLKLQ